MFELIIYVLSDVTWKARIGCAGNRPEDWLEYINHLKADPTIKQGTVFSAYSEAIEVHTNNTLELILFTFAILTFDQIMTDLQY